MPQIPAGWKETTLGEVVEFIDWDRGKNYPNWDDFKTTWFCVFLNAKNLPNRIFDFSETMFISEEKDLILRKGKLKRWDYVMTTRWTIGNFAYYNDQVVYSNMRINSWMVIIRAYKDLINEKFLWLFFSSNIFKYYLSWFTSWSAVPQLPIKDIKQLPILLPPLPEQQAIAAVLSSFDDKIELLRAENQTLEQMGQELFKERFCKWKIGDELPEGWRVGKLGEEITPKQGKYIDAKYISDNQNDIHKYPIYWGSWIRGYVRTFDYSNPMTILTCRWNWCGLIQFTERYSTITNSCMVFDSETVWLSSERIYLRSKNINFESVISGSAQPQITISSLFNVSIVVPDQETLSKFDLVIKPLFNKIRANSEQIQTLSSARDQLLSKLMSWEVRVEF